MGEAGVDLQAAAVRRLVPFTEVGSTRHVTAAHSVEVQGPVTKVANTKVQRAAGDTARTNRFRSWPSCPAIETKPEVEAVGLSVRPLKESGGFSANDA
jgi:hypothetical protein